MAGKDNHRLVFRGDILIGFELDQVKTGLMTLLKTSTEQQLELMFSGKTVVLKKNLSATYAEKYQQAFERAGILVSIEPPLPVLTPEPAVISSIERMLKEGKKVAILIIDMQAEIEDIWLSSEKSRVIPEEMQVLDAFSDNKNVLFIDVNMEGNGETIADLAHSIKKNTLRRSFVKSDTDAFFSESLKNSQLENIIHGYLRDELEKLAVTELVPMGCFSGRCVRATTQGAIREDFNVHLDKDLLIVGDTPSLEKRSKEEMFAQAERAWARLEKWVISKGKTSKLTYITTETSESRACAP